MLGSLLDSLLSFLRESPETAYWIVFFGSILEGETIILGASALAAAGVLSLSKVGSIAFCVTLLVDQGLYFIGHYLYKHPGRPLSERYPRLYKKSKKAVILLKKYDIWFILMFRFVYGVRTISPIVIGLCGSPARRFVPLNVVAALLWTVVSCFLGYSLGDFLFDENGSLVSGHMHRIQFIVVAVLVLLVGALALSHLLSMYRRKSKLKIPGVDAQATQHVEKSFYESTHVDEADQDKTPRS